MALQVWLPLDGDLRNQGLTDVKVTNNGATIDNNGKIGKCYAFDGTNDYITTIDTAYPEIFSGDFSVCFWIYSSTDGSRDVYFGNYGISGSGNWFNIERDTSNHLRFWWNNGAIDKHFTTFSIISSDDWTHIAFVRKGNSVRVYKNASFMEEYTATISNSIPSTATTFHIGGDYRTSGDLVFGGKMNDFRIYDHALSYKEVKELAKGLILHYPMNGFQFCENILTNSSGYQGTTNWGGLTSVGEENGYKYLIAKRTDTTSTSRTFCTHTAITSLVSSWQPGDKFTISGWYKVPSSETQQTGGNMFIRWAQSSASNGDADTGFTTSTTVKDIWIRFENTYTVPPNFASGKAANFYLSAFAAQKVATVYWKEIKLEKGDKATPWCPAKTDTLYSAMGYDSNIELDCAPAGNQNDGTIVGTITAAADSPRYETSYYFDGIDSAIQVPYNATVFQTNFTINLWFKKTELGSKSYETLFGGPGGFEMDTRAGASTTLSLYMASTRGGNVFSPFNFNEWYMVTLVNDGTNELYYINGELKKTIEKKSMPTGNYFIGAWSTSSRQNFRGYISDFRVYCTALSAGDIKELYDTAAQIDKDGNVYAYEFKEA